MNIWPFRKAQPIPSFLERLENLVLIDQAFRQVAEGTACERQKELVRLRLEIAYLKSK